MSFLFIYSIDSLNFRPVMLSQIQSPKTNSLLQIKRSRSLHKRPNQTPSGSPSHRNELLIDSGFPLHSIAFMRRRAKGSKISQTGVFEMKKKGILKNNLLHFPLSDRKNKRLLNHQVQFTVRFKDRIKTVYHVEPLGHLHRETLPKGFELLKHRIIKGFSSGFEVIQEPCKCCNAY